jgi:hypothetical protein
MAETKSRQTAGNNKKSADGTRGCEKGRSLCCGAIIVLFCAANIRYLPTGSLNIYLRTGDESVLNSGSLSSHDNRADTEESRFCQRIHEAQEIFEPANEPTRKMAHVFVVNSGHLPLLRNALVSIQSLPIPWKSIVFALDGKLCPSLHEQSPELKPLCIEYAPRLLEQMEQDEPVFYHSNLNTTAQVALLNETAYWGSVMHAVLINLKLYGLRDILNCGLATFLTDADIVFLKDPRPYFVGEDILAQKDHNPVNFKLDMNSGFMFWRNTPQNLNLSQALIKEPTEWWHIDQSRVNDLIFARGINMTLLSISQFPNGAVMYAKDSSGNQMPLSNETVAAHANWNARLDQKKEILATHGLWLIE